MGQTAQLKLEYLMTLQADLDPPQAIDAASLIFNVRGGRMGRRSREGLLRRRPTGCRSFLRESGAWMSAGRSSQTMSR